MKSSYESDSPFIDDEKDEAGNLYQFIFEMQAEEDEKARQEKVQVSSCSEDKPLPSDEETTTHEADLSCWEFIKTKTTCETAGEQEQTDVVEIREQQYVDVKKNVKEKKVFRRRVRVKPWMKRGADISDYFNFNFDEESWTDYCTKQASLRAAYTGTHNQIIGRAGHRKDREKDPGHASSHTRSSRSRQRTEQTPGLGSASHQENACGWSHWRTFGCLQTQTGSVYHRPRPPPPYTAATDRSPSKHLGVLSTSRGPSSSGVTSLVQKTAACSEFRKCGFDQINHPIGERNRKRHNKKKEKGFSAHTRSPSKHLGIPPTSRGPSSSGVTSLVQKTAACSAGLINNSKTIKQQGENEDHEFRKCGFDQINRPIGERNRKRHNKKKEKGFSAHTRDEQQRHRDAAKQGRSHHDLHMDNEAGDHGEKRRQGNQEEGQI